MNILELKNIVHELESSESAFTRFVLTFSEPVNIHKASRYGVWKVDDNGKKTKSKVSKKKYNLYLNTNVQGYFFGYKSKASGKMWQGASNLPLDKLIKVEVLKEKKELTQEEQYKKSCQSFLNRCHKNLWADIQEQCKKYIETGAKEDLPDFIENFGEAKFVSIRSKMDGNVDFYMEELKNSIEYELPYRNHFPTKSYNNRGRDRTFSIERNQRDGLLKGYFSSEYPNCGNGHYYLLISPTTAVYYERD